MTDSVQIGEYRIAKFDNSKNLFLHFYDRNARQMRHRTLGTPNLAAACKIVQAWVDAGHSGDPKLFVVDKQIETWDQLFAWDYELYGRHLPSRSAHIAARKHFAAFDISKKLSDTEPSFTEHFKKHMLEKGWTIATSQRAIAVARAAVNRAVEAKLCQMPSRLKNVETQADRDAEPDRGRTMTTKEIAAFIDECQTVHSLTAMVHLINTLSRPGAVLAADAAQIDCEHGLYALNPKGRKQTKKYRPTVPITETLAPWVDGLPDGPIITCRGRPIKCIKTAIRGARRRAKLGDDVTAYSIRHSGTRYLKRYGVPPDERSLLLGHTPAGQKKTTRKYNPDDPYEQGYLKTAKKGLEAFVREIAKHCKRHDILTPPWQLKPSKDKP